MPRDPAGSQALQARPRKLHLLSHRSCSQDRWASGVLHRVRALGQGIRIYRFELGGEHVVTSQLRQFAANPSCHNISCARLPVEAPGIDVLRAGGYDGIKAHGISNIFIVCFTCPQLLRGPDLRWLRRSFKGAAMGRSCGKVLGSLPLLGRSERISDPGSRRILRRARGKLDNKLRLEGSYSPPNPATDGQFKNHVECQSLSQLELLGISTKSIRSHKFAGQSLSTQ